MAATNIYVKQILTRNYVQPRLYTKHQISIDQKAALDAANGPDADNAFATVNDLGDTDNTITIQTKSADFDLAPGDEGTYIRYTGATDISVAVPNTVEIGQPITIFQAGAGVITLTAGTGITALNGDAKTGGQGKGIQTMKVADGIIDNIGGVA